MLYESVAAFFGRRRRAILLHAALKVSLEDQQFTLEVTPALPASNVRNEVTGLVGMRGADRRLFRYQVCLRPGSSLPDERWAVGPRVRVSNDPAVAELVLDLAAAVPGYVWGRRRAGHPEMWTSDSCVAWLLGRAGIDVSRLQLHEGTRAPGWSSGIVEARDRGPANIVPP